MKLFRPSVNDQSWHDINHGCINILVDMFIENDQYFYILLVLLVNPLHFLADIAILYSVYYKFNKCCQEFWEQSNVQYAQRI